jgi:hypothetical protein
MAGELAWPDQPTGVADDQIDFRGDQQIRQATEPAGDVRQSCHGLRAHGSHWPMVGEQCLKWGRTGRRHRPEHSERSAAGLGQGEAGKQHAQAVAQAERTEDGQRSHLE